MLGRWKKAASVWLPAWLLFYSMVELQEPHKNTRWAIWPGRTQWLKPPASDLFLPKRAEFCNKAELWGCWRKWFAAALVNKMKGTSLETGHRVIKRIEVKVGSQRARVAHQCETVYPHSAASNENRKRHSGREWEIQGSPSTEPKWSERWLHQRFGVLDRGSNP